MRGKKPISTISYNSKDFLLLKLKELTDKHIVANWMFIYHKAEEDERSDHFHLYIEPNKLIDSMDLVEHFKEFDPKHPDKPLGVRPFNPSKVDKEYHPDHWILYCLHDPDYLAYKHESRSYHYTLDQIEAFDRDLLEDNYYHAQYHSDMAEEKTRLKLVKEADNVVDLYYNGHIPPQLIGNYSRLKSEEKKLEYMRKNQNGVLDRGGRVSHTPLFRPYMRPHRDHVDPLDM